MRIGIYLPIPYPGSIGGMEQYVRSLVWYAAHRNEGHEFFLFLNKACFDSFEETGTMKKIRIEMNHELEAQLLHHIHALRLDVWFCPLLVLFPTNVPIPSVVNIPDIQHEYYPEFFADAIVQERKTGFQHTVAHADYIITLSEFSKRTIMEKLHVPENKIFAIHLDAAKEFYACRKERKELIKRKYQLPDRFALYPSSTWPHKNHMRLLQAALILRGKYNHIQHFVFTGGATPDVPHRLEALRNYVREHHLSEQVQFLGYIPQEEMPYVYLNSSFLVFPSLLKVLGCPWWKRCERRPRLFAPTSAAFRRSSATARCFLIRTIRKTLL